MLTSASSNAEYTLSPAEKELVQENTLFIYRALSDMMLAGERGDLRMYCADKPSQPEFLVFSGTLDNMRKLSQLDLLRKSREIAEKAFRMCEMPKHTL